MFWKEGNTLFIYLLTRKKKILFRVGEGWDNGVF